MTWNADGLILICILHDDFIKVKSRYKKPMVLADSYAPRDIVDYMNVEPKDERGSYEMICYLINQGHRRIAFLADNMKGVDYIRYSKEAKSFAHSQ